MPRIIIGKKLSGSMVQWRMFSASHLNKLVGYHRIHQALRKAVLLRLDLLRRAELFLWEPNRRRPYQWKDFWRAIPFAPVQYLRGSCISLSHYPFDRNLERQLQ